MPWSPTTHEWARSVDADHLAEIRRRAGELAPGGVLQLVLEVVAYCEDEAEAGHASLCRVTFHADGSISVADDGRGTDTRVDDEGRTVRKPVMSTKDLRFFDAAEPPLLAGRWPRRGMSVVSALSTWLVHTNRRTAGAWTQRYEHGVPVTDLVPAAPDGSTGTTVHFLPDAVYGLAPLPGAVVDLPGEHPHLRVEVADER